MTVDPYMIAVGLIGTQELTDKLLADTIQKIRIFIPDLDADSIASVQKRLEAQIGISMSTGQGLHGGDQEPWLEENKATIKWNYWNAYATELRSNGFSRDVIRVLDEDTDNILNECGNPKRESSWWVRGLVMGDVQSGKTANYCGLINKAADAGYKFVVLLTGMIEELRAQSQERMDAGFVGRDSRTIFEGGREKRPIGSGRFKQTVPNVLTSIDFDFLTANKKVLGGIPLENINEPVLLVMKKNKSPLQNLRSFLDSQMSKGTKQLTLPLLLVDDEADNASVNAKRDEDPSAINKLIREILRRFSKSTYVAYTATPFANVFINPDNDDLFPSNFVYSLNTPTNYIGVASVFSDDGTHASQIRDILDVEELLPYKHKKDHQIAKLPPSLEDAIGTFVLSCAVRDLRTEPLRHRSMLINATRFTDVQERLATLVKNHLYALTEEVKQYLAADSLWQKHGALRKLHSLWEIEYADSGVSWADVRKTLYDSIASLKVLTINQKSEAADRLNYGAYRRSEKGRRVIAIGGLTLSRGLTLEGLCVSYFYRNSKAYDTLLQMGRWFGYRPGYEDLCRIWMDPDVQSWFSHVAEVVAELKLDIRRMHANRQPPQRFGMRVRSHPDALIVTALNKMRNAQEIELDVSYSESGAETPFLPRRPEVNQANLDRVSRFLTTLPAPGRFGNRHYWKDVPAAKVASLLADLEISQMNMPFVTDLSGRDRPIVKFIAENQVAKLQTWDVCLPPGSGTGVNEIAGPLSPFPARLRQFERVPAGSDYLKLNKQRVGEISDEMVGLSESEIERAREEWIKFRKDDSGKSAPGSAYRRFRERPLLTIHIIEPTDPQGEAKNRDRMMPSSEVGSRALVAIGLSFPKFEDGDKAARVPYRLNKVALRAMGLIPEQDEDDDSD